MKAQGGACLLLLVLFVAWCDGQGTAPITITSPRAGDFVFSEQNFTVRWTVRTPAAFTHVDILLLHGADAAVSSDNRTVSGTAQVLQQDLAASVTSVSVRTSSHPAGMYTLVVRSSTRVLGVYVHARRNLRVEDSTKGSGDFTVISWTPTETGVGIPVVFDISVRDFFDRPSTYPNVVECSVSGPVDTVCNVSSTTTAHVYTGTFVPSSTGEFYASAIVNGGATPLPILINVCPCASPPPPPVSTEDTVTENDDDDFLAGAGIYEFALYMLPAACAVTCAVTAGLVYYRRRNREKEYAERAAKIEQRSMRSQRSRRNLSSKYEEVKQTEEESPEEKYMTEVDNPHVKTLFKRLRETLKAQNTTVEDAFNAFDTDHNRSLSLEELMEALKKLGVSIDDDEKKSVSRVFKMMSDTGEVDFDQFFEFVTDIPTRQAPTIPLDDISPAPAPAPATNGVSTNGAESSQPIGTNAVANGHRSDSSDL